MTKIGKKAWIAIALALTLCLAVFATVFTACVTKTEEPTYSVTVLLSDGSAAAGVEVSIKKGSATFEKKTTGDDGKATFALADDDYTAELKKIPSRYELPSGTSLALSSAKRDLTVTLAKKPAYTVKLVKEDGTPFVSDKLNVQMCTLSGNCLTPVDVDANGVAEIISAPGDYHIIINNLPAGYTYPKDENGYYTGKNFSATDMTMTVTITEIKNVAAQAMTDADKTAYAAVNSYFSASTTTAYEYKETLEANASAFFMLTAPITGSYRIFSVDDASYSYGETLNATANSQENLIYYKTAGAVTMEEGKTYYFQASNSASNQIAADLVIVPPAASSIELHGESGTARLTFAQEKAFGTITFVPSKTAVYKATVQGTTTANIVCSLISSVNYDDSAEFKAGASATYKVTDANAPVYFHVAIKDASVPATVDVKIEKLNDVENVTNTVQITETLTQFGKPEGKTLKYLEPNASAVLVYNETDKYYHLGAADGAVVVVNLTKVMNSEYFLPENSIAYIDQNGRTSLILDITSDEDKADMTKGATFGDYRKFLHGFEDYTVTSTPTGNNYNIPDNITETNYYANYVNEDGVYPLTEELATFLKGLFRNYPDLATKCDKAYAYLIPCGYYE